MIYLIHIALAMAMMQDGSGVIHTGVDATTECHKAGDGCNTECCTTGSLGSECKTTLAYCYAPPYIVTAHPPIEEPIDVPAIEVGDKVVTCHDSCSATMCLAIAYCEKLKRQTCSDPSRYLLGPNGKGEYICHRSQL